MRRPMEEHAANNNARNQTAEFERRRFHWWPNGGKENGPEATLTATQRRPVNGRRRDASPSIRFADCALRDSNDDKRYDRRGN